MHGNYSFRMIDGRIIKILNIWRHLENNIFCMGRFFGKLLICYQAHLILQYIVEKPFVAIFQGKVVFLIYAADYTPMCSLTDQ